MTGTRAAPRGGGGPCNILNAATRLDLVSPTSAPAPHPHAPCREQVKACALLLSCSSLGFEAQDSGLEVGHALLEGGVGLRGLEGERSRESVRKRRAVVCLVVWSCAGHTRPRPPARALPPRQRRQPAQRMAEGVLPRPRGERGGRQDRAERGGESRRAHAQKQGAGGRAVERAQWERLLGPRPAPPAGAVRGCWRPANLPEHAGSPPAHQAGVCEGRGARPGPTSSSAHERAERAPLAPALALPAHLPFNSLSPRAAAPASLRTWEASTRWLSQRSLRSW